MLLAQQPGILVTILYFELFKAMDPLLVRIKYVSGFLLKLCYSLSVVNCNDLICFFCK